MNNSDKIKALLEQPNVKSVSAIIRGHRHITDESNCVLTGFNKSGILFGGTADYPHHPIDECHIVSIGVEFHAPLEISEGDLVMTPDGEGWVQEHYPIFKSHKVRGDQFAGSFLRHEMALLQKAGES